VSYSGDQAEAQRSEIYRTDACHTAVHCTEAYRTDSYRTEVYRTEVHKADEADAPEEFLWEGQVHRVRAVLTHRAAPEAVSVPAGATAEVDAGEVWRVRASAGRHGYRGVFDLRFDWAAGRWTVTHIPMMEGE
jgi:hypothetical protein